MYSELNKILMFIFFNLYLKIGNWIKKIILY